MIAETTRATYSRVTLDLRIDENLAIINQTMLGCFGSIDGDDFVPFRLKRDGVAEFGDYRDPSKHLTFNTTVRECPIRVGEEFTTDETYELIQGWTYRILIAADI